jgi:hypothetical protein
MRDQRLSDAWSCYYKARGKIVAIVFVLPLITISSVQAEKVKPGSESKQSQSASVNSDNKEVSVPPSTFLNR